MDELERQLRDLAAHRASQVPEFDATSLTSATDDEGHGPNWGALLAVAAIIVALLVGGGYLLFGRTDDDHPRVVAAPSSSDAPVSTAAPTTTPPTTVPPTTTPATTVPPATIACPETGNDTNAQQGTGNVSPPPLAGLERVQVWSADCADRVAFKFGQPEPDWNVAYANAPLTHPASGEPVTVAGSAFLVVTFRNASGADANGSETTLPAPSGVRELAMTQNFEGVVTWVIGLDAVRPFGVSYVAGELIVEIDAGSARPMSCVNPAAQSRVEIPQGWYVRMARGLDPCSSFAKTPVSYIAGDPPPPGPELRLDPTPFASLPATPPATELVSSHTTTVDGRSAIVTESRYGSRGLYAGSRLYQWSIDWGAAGTLTILTIEGGTTPYDVNRSAVDQIANSARFVP